MFYICAFITVNETILMRSHWKKGIFNHFLKKFFKCNLVFISVRQDEILFVWIWNINGAWIKTWIPLSDVFRKEITTNLFRPSTMVIWTILCLVYRVIISAITMFCVRNVPETSFWKPSNWQPLFLWMRLDSIRTWILYGFFWCRFWSTHFSCMDLKPLGWQIAWIKEDLSMYHIKLFSWWSNFCFFQDHFHFTKYTVRRYYI